MRGSLGVSVGVTALAVLIGFTGCGRKKHVRVTPPRVQPRIGDTEEGIASWYGHPYHGRQAADGEIYDMEKLVAAHRTLPFHTWVRVHNLDNSKSVDVEIIDRGPFIDGRIIDLSHRAAQEVDMIGPGTAKVRIEIIEPPPGVVAVAASVCRAGGSLSRQVHGRTNEEEMTARYGTAKAWCCVPEVRQSGACWWATSQAKTGAGALAERIRGEGGRTGSGVRSATCAAAIIDPVHAHPWTHLTVWWVVSRSASPPHYRKVGASRFARAPAGRERYRQRGGRPRYL